MHRCPCEFGDPGAVCGLSHLGGNGKRQYCRCGELHTLLRLLSAEGKRYCTRLIAEHVSIPVIASGGAGTKDHFYDALVDGKADAALAASLFHYKELEIMELKNYLADRGVSVRR